MPISTKYSKGLRNLIMSMLNINPKKRPTINEILDKPIIKKRIVAYIIWMYRNRSKLEDAYISTVQQQVKMLGLEPLIEKYMTKSQSNVDDQSTSLSQSITLKEKKKLMEKQLRSEIDEKDDIEERLIELRRKKEQEIIKGRNKEVVLLNKEERRLQDLQKRNNQLEQIRNDNAKAQAEAKRKFQSQYQESDAIKEVLNSPLEDSGQDTFEDDFAYDDNDFVSNSQMDKIEEVDEEGSIAVHNQKPSKGQDQGGLGAGLVEGELDSKIEDCQKKLLKKTNNIQQLQEDLKETTKQLNFDLSVTGNKGELNSGDNDDDIDAASYDTPFNISEIEDSQDDSEEVDNSLGAVFDSKIKDLQM